jgi:hypothetical protein
MGSDALKNQTVDELLKDSRQETFGFCKNNAGFLKADSITLHSG